MLFGMEGLSRVMVTLPDQMVDYKRKSPSTPSSTIPSLPLSSKRESGSPTATKVMPIIKPQFLDLPVEIRLRIYAYLLPPRTYTVVTNNAYPAGTIQCLNTISTPRDSSYSILTQAYNVLPSTWYLPIIFTCHQIHTEAIPLLYGSQGIKFNFGCSTHVISQFLADKSTLARESVRSIALAKEISSNGAVGDEWAGLWRELKGLLPGLRDVDITLWSADGSASCFPVSFDEVDDLCCSIREKNTWESMRALQEFKRSVDEKWRELRLINDIIMNAQGLRSFNITWWDFDCGGDQNREMNENLPDEQIGKSKTKTKAGVWLASKMVLDKVLLGRMLYDGGVREGKWTIEL